MVHCHTHFFLSQYAYFSFRLRCVYEVCVLDQCIIAGLDCILSLIWVLYLGIILTLSNRAIIARLVLVEFGIFIINPHTDSDFSVLVFSSTMLRPSIRMKSIVPSQHATFTKSALLICSVCRLERYVDARFQPKMTQGGRFAYVFGRSAISTHVGHVWFVANYVILCLWLVVRIEQLTLNRKVRQNYDKLARDLNVQLFS